MEVFKIKISPEVLRNELTTQSYSGVSFGYYSGLTDVLTAGTVSLGIWNVGSPETPGNLISFGFEPIEGDIPIIWINKTGSTGYNWSSYLQRVKTGSTVTFVTEDGQRVNYSVRLATETTPTFLYLFLQLSGTGITIPVGSSVELIVTQPDTSQLIDLSIPIFLKQNYEDLGYYSPFDGEFSQLNEEVNFTFTFSDINPYEITIYNTSDNRKTYLQQATYRIDWGDSTPVQDVTVFIPESITHTYLNLPEPTTYTVTFFGTTSLGNYVITKTFDVPYYNTPTINNPFGEVIFETNNGSWSATPQSQNFITYYDANNTVESQASYNYVSVPFIISGFTTSRLQELKVYGFNPLINDLNINLKDGTLGRVISQSPEYTAYTINDQNYLDFSDGSTVFVVQSYGFLENMLTATTITKMEYLMNVIEQPEIQSNVFIERGKNSGMENFRRIGEIGNTGSLNNYGYKFFDVRNYNEI
jgi:hypothetical protein